MIRIFEKRSWMILLLLSLFIWGVLDSKALQDRKLESFFEHTEMLESLEFQKRQAQIELIIEGDHLSPIKPDTLLIERLFDTRRDR